MVQYWNFVNSTNNLLTAPRTHKKTLDIIITKCIKGKVISFYLIFCEYISFSLETSDQAVSRLPTRDNIKRRIRKIRSNNDYAAVPNDPNFNSICIV